MDENNVVKEKRLKGRICCKEEKKLNFDNTLCKNNMIKSSAYLVM
jgi:hypothetical protein